MLILIVIQYSRARKRSKIAESLLTGYIKQKDRYLKNKTLNVKICLNN